MKIRISTAAYNEIVTALERAGVKADGSTELTLEKGTQLSCPIDFKMVTIRRDVAAIAKDCYKDAAGLHDLEWSKKACSEVEMPEHLKKPLEFVEFCDKLMEWVTTDKEYNKPKGWK